MGRRSRNFKLSGNRKKKVNVKPKQKYDYSKVKGRIVGQLPDGCPIVGSASDLIKPWTIAPFELIDNQLNDYKSVEMDKFNTGDGVDIDLWGEETQRQINPLLVTYTTNYNRELNYLNKSYYI